MFSDLDSDDYAKLGRIAGIVLFAVAFVLPAVHEGPNDYDGFFCAAWSISGGIGFFASLFGPDGPSGLGFFFMLSGLIAPLVAAGLFIPSDKFKRLLAKTIPFLLVAPWIVFGWPDTGGWGTVTLHPLIGHYVWTAGCLLIFTPEFVALFTATREKGDDSPEEASSSEDTVA
jgi:hypothetical protein